MLLNKTRDVVTFQIVIAAFLLIILVIIVVPFWRVIVTPSPRWMCTPSRGCPSSSLQSSGQRKRSPSSYRIPCFPAPCSTA